MAATTTQWILELVDRITSPLRSASEAAETAAEKVGDVVEQVENLSNASSRMEKLGKGMFYLNQIGEGVDRVNQALDASVDPGVRFQSAMAEVRAIAQLSAKDTEVVADKARDLSKAFGADAAEGAGIFSEILSKLGPDLAKYPTVLDSMGRNSMTLSKTMKGDVNGAVGVLTASFNAFGLSLDNPEQAAKGMTDQMNIIAKAAQIGAATVPDITDALVKLGPAAKLAGVSFEETNAAIQIFGQQSIPGTISGTKLNAILSKMLGPTDDAAKMMKQLGVDVGTLSDKSIPLADRLQELVPVIGNQTLLMKLFGLENASAAQILIGNTDKMRQWTEEVKGSTSATDQAAIIMDTYAEKQKRMQAYIDDLKISFFNFVEPILPAVKMVGILVSAIVSLGVVAWSTTQLMTSGIVKAVIAWTVNLGRMALSTVINCQVISAAIYSIPIIGWIALAIAAITVLTVWLFNKVEAVRVFLFGVWEVVKTYFVSYFKTIKAIVTALIEILNPINWFKKDWHIADVWKNLKNEVYNNAVAIGNAWEAGKQKGRESWAKDHPKEEAKKTDKYELANGAGVPANQEKENQKKNGSTGDSGSDLGLGGKGSGSIKNITMNVTFNNTITAAGGSVREVSERVKRELLAVLTDTVPAVA